MQRLFQIIGAVSSIAALSLVAIAETSAAQADSIGLNVNGVNVNWVVLLVIAVILAVGLVVGCSKKRAERAERDTQARVLNAITKTVAPIAAEFPFSFVSFSVFSETKATVSDLRMDRDGERLRFLEFNYSDGMKTADLIVPVSSRTVWRQRGRQRLRDHIN